jgi:hypothetical protein
VDADLPGAVAAEAVDLDGDGDLDLALVTPAGRVELWTNEGGNANGWMTWRSRDSRPARRR